MSWLPKRDKLDPVQASVIDFAVAHEGNSYVKGEAGTGEMYQIAAADGLLRGLVGKLVARWRRIASGFGAMSSTGRALGVAWRDII